MSAKKLLANRYGKPIESVDRTYAPTAITTIIVRTQDETHQTKQRKIKQQQIQPMISQTCPNPQRIKRG